jgi:hypothetical protein
VYQPDKGLPRGLDYRRACELLAAIVKTAMRDVRTGAEPHASEAATWLDDHRSLLREGRKAFAVHVNKQHPAEKHLLFALLDNKDIAPTIMARLDAEAICAASAAGDIEA